MAFGTSEHWQGRAEEAATVADNMNDEQARRSMLLVAASYEKMAQQAKVREDRERDKRQICD